MKPDPTEHDETVIDHVLAVVAVSDFDTSHRWYQRLFDTPATNVPMPGNLAEWRLTDTGWLQMFHAPDHAGHSLANIAVHDIDRHIDALRDRHIDTGDIIDVNKAVRLCSIDDPDGNTITFIGNFRERY
jgi:glyoxylase I family protein